MEINPNHPVTQAVHDSWHKVVALLMFHYGIIEFPITEALVHSMPQDNAIVFDTRNGGAVVRLVSLDEAMRLAQKEGGLPI